MKGSDMNNIITIHSRNTKNIHWLPCISLGLNDEVPCNGWIMAKHDDGFDPTIEFLAECQIGDFVDNLIPNKFWENHTFMFFSVIVDPNDFPYISQ
jgi:hypothetical protein